jgi:hypothetical protein
LQAVGKVGRRKSGFSSRNPLGGAEVLATLGVTIFIGVGKVASGGEKKE